MNGPMDGWMDGWWMDGWMDEWRGLRGCAVGSNLERNSPGQGPSNCMRTGALGRRTRFPLPVQAKSSSWPCSFLMTTEAKHTAWAKKATYNAARSPARILKPVWHCMHCALSPCRCPVNSHSPLVDLQRRRDACGTKEASHSFCGSSS